jgi:hypothetical protein
MSRHPGRNNAGVCRGDPATGALPPHREPVAAPDAFSERVLTLR